MDVYTGKVVATQRDRGPFLAILYDASGTVIAEFPVPTEAEGETKLAEALNDLQNQPSSSVLD